MNSELLPPFSLTIEGEHTTTIYSDMEMQLEFIKSLHDTEDVKVFDLQEGLYQRLTVEDNIAFFRKWFRSKMSLPEVLMMFELQHSAKKPLYKCSKSEVRRVYYAKYLMSGVSPMLFHEPVQGVDVNTTNSFIQLLQRLKSCHIPVLVLVSNLEHAIMLGDVAYKLHQHALSPVEMDEGEDETKEEADDPGLKRHNNLFKIPAKVDDKVILFDPLEIDYMESQDGKAMIVVNDQTYAMDTTLSEMEKQLEVYGFYRCHRSYIVNLQKVREIITWSKNTYSLRIDNKSQSTIPLSRTKIQDIQEKFSLK